MGDSSHLSRRVSHLRFYFPDRRSLEKEEPLVTFKYPAEELGQAGAPPLPEGYAYTFDVGESGDLHGAIFDPAGTKAAYDRLWVAHLHGLYDGATESRTWAITDLVEMAKRLYEEAFPSDEPRKKLAKDIARFLDIRLPV
jgi:hypothetical protein